MMRLFVKECVQMAKSAIYWLVVGAMALDFFSQISFLGSDIEKPKPDQAYYEGVNISKDKQIQMGSTLYNLTEEYLQGSYLTYPMAFAKRVTLGDKDQHRVSDILAELTGLSTDKALQAADDKATDEGLDEDDGLKNPLVITPKSGVTDTLFGQRMQEICKLVGPGSNYTKDKIKNSAEVPMTYTAALSRYKTLITKDHITGGAARLYCDYVGLALAILPMFLAVTRELRDKRSQMAELIYARQTSSFAIIGSRFLATVFMSILPVLLLSIYPLNNCIATAGRLGASPDYLAFVKYILGIILPGVMIVTALAMCLTQLTDTAIAIVVQGIWWFASANTTMSQMEGGAYGWHLLIRNNDMYTRNLFLAGFDQLVANRIFYAGLSLVLVGITVFIFAKKRKGEMNIYGTLIGNWKRKHPAQHAPAPVAHADASAPVAASDRELQSGQNRIGKSA